MDSLAWFATTPEGEQLGKLAAQMVQVEWTTVPIWFAPFEPFRWLITMISSGYPHAKWLAVPYLLLALLIGFLVFWRMKTIWWHRLTVALIAGLNALLTVGGGYIAVNWVNAIATYGVRWVVPENTPFVLANLHTHTTQSNGFLTPEQTVLWHLQRGYKVVAITDSNTVKGGEIARSFVERTNLPVTVLVGEEFRGKTHLVLLNIRSDISPRDFDVPEAIREAKRQGGIVIAAHPWTSKHSVEELVEWGVDGFEIVNGSVLGDEKLQALCKQRKLAALGNLDFRSDYTPDTATVLPKWADTPEEVARALKEGKCAAIYFREQVSVGESNVLKGWFGELKELWRTGATTNLIGFIFWALVGWAMLRRKNELRNPQNSLSLKKFVTFCLISLALFALSASFLVWTMARDLKKVWFPPLPTVIAIWSLACFANWLIWWRIENLNFLGRTKLK
ncbi:MAG: hypothetical protein NZ805_01885 [Armatimonadetes bacterium]|nr:hypothetical protein [Armatimonadota bacterium]MDW8027122.1 hypothetical protein [Armatimonadota bacterium]